MTFKKGDKPYAPWKPGQSGNPNGRPKTPPELKALATAAYPEALQLAINLIRGDYSTVVEEIETIGRGSGKETVTRRVRKQMPVPPETALKAAEFIADRALGKAVQPVAGADGEGPLQIQKIERVILQLEDSRNGQTMRVIEHDPREPRRGKDN